MRICGQDISSESSPEKKIWDDCCTTQITTPAQSRQPLGVNAIATALQSMSSEQKWTVLLWLCFLLKPRNATWPLLLQLSTSCVPVSFPRACAQTRQPRRFQVQSTGLRRVRERRRIMCNSSFRLYRGHRGRSYCCKQGQKA